MRIIISPAKKMNVDLDSFAVESLPRFIGEAERLKAVLQGMSPKELQTLWRCSDAIAGLNVERLREMDLRRRLTPAVMAYEGIQYQYMAPGVLETGHLDYIREHLRILSGFYGLLCPFDGVAPYRLEMQARLSVDGGRDLYAFWGGKLADQLAAETGLVLNLASREYSRAVEPYLPSSVRFLTCTFGEWKDGKLVEKGTMCKMARGQMVRWLAENHITDPEKLRDFTDLDYRFSPDLSRENNVVFIKSARGRGDE
ncbi:peroxide stress protein YaaA [uncultured Dysosmobacter sp.]|uniref:peroxide stress protein YaaA n=1 Tax=uncultured Dysosmobacter sp. TaxID=2591384 RepID=UPI0026044CE5|nr:peroxide stress protein YaaA [uncultured Dysosmobacter sp.]